MEYPTFSPPQMNSAPVEGVTFPLRVGAKIIDLFIHNMIGVVFGLSIGLLIGAYSASTGAPTEEILNETSATRLLSSILSTLGFVLYCAICEAYYGATLGKLILGMHVVNKEGGQISFGAAFIRALAFFIDQILFGFVAYSSMKNDPLQRRNGDKWAGTVVVKRSTVNESEIPSGCMFVFVLALGMAFDGLLQVLPVLFSL